MSAVRTAAVVGSTRWGTVLAVMLAGNGLAVRLCAYDEADAEALRRDGENARLQPGLRFPPSLTVAHASDAALEGADLLVVAVPSSTLRDNLRALRPHLEPDTLVLSAVKGLERDTGKRMSQVFHEELTDLRHPLCVLSGPNLSREIARGLPAATIVACEDLATAEKVRDAFMSPVFRVYTNEDVAGVELAGDLMATCYSPLSRNHRVGIELAKGKTLDDVLSSLGQVAEGVTTIAAAMNLSRRYGVEMPISEKTYQVLFEGLDPRRAVAELMLRAPRHELHGVRTGPPAEKGAARAPGASGRWRTHPAG